MLILESFQAGLSWECVLNKREFFKEAYDDFDVEKIINYDDVKGIRIEARQKLNKVKPQSIGQASRISGVSPADVSVLLIYLEQQRRK